MYEDSWLAHILRKQTTLNAEILYYLSFGGGGEGVESIYNFLGVQISNFHSYGEG